MKFSCALFSLLFILSTTLYSQTSNPNQNGTVSGSIVDENLHPIQYASVYLFRVPDSLTAGMSITDADGRFNITNIPFGEYYIELDFIGYSKHRSSVFTLSSDKPSYRLNKFKLSEKSTRLGTVEVKAQKEMLQSNLDKTVYNVESSISSEGATAVEVLQDIPSVNVDLDGNVTLRGSENVTILVDGRPSNLTLEQIPAAQIESIEVISNPSARLEPDGMAGILNVILKKRKESGFNGLIGIGGALSLFDKKAFFPNYDGNINLNYSYNKINVFLNYNFRHWGRRSSGSLDRTSWINGDTTHLYQENYQDRSGYSHNLRTGLDWFINKKNTLSFAFGYNYNQSKSNSELYSNNSHYQQLIYDPYIEYNQNGYSRNFSHNFSGNIYYKKTFDTKGQELTADFYFSQMNRDNKDGYSQLFIIPDPEERYYQLTQTLGLNRNASAQIDFVTPAGNGGRIETGYKFAMRHVGQDYSLLNGSIEDQMEIDSTQTNNFLYSEYINAAYFIYSNSFWDKLKLQVGLRGEMAHTTSDLKSADTAYKKNYYNLFPTLHLRYDINKNHSLQLSYSRRVSRPRIYQLNPFVDISDKLNLQTGNPNLTPEFVNSFELGYLMTINKSSLNLTAFYRQRKDIITRYTQLFEEELEDGTTYTYTLTSYENLNKSQNFGLEVVYGQRLWKFWKINLSGDFYRVIINSNDLIDENLSNDWAWGFRLNQTFNLPQNWDMQLNFRYRSASLTTGSMGWGTGGVGQGKRSASYSLGFAVKKGFFNNRFVTSLNIRNLLYSPETRVLTYSHEAESGYDALSIRKGSSFQVNLSLSYKINNFKKRIEKNSIEEEEMFE